MRETTVHSLAIARTLLERAEPLCVSDDRYLASAGLVILQDALETVFYALLIELGIDEEKNLERKSFDELIGELKAAEIPIAKSGTLKALNKQRVLTKHYAQVAEPVTVRSYLAAARFAIDAAMQKVLGRSLSELFIADLLKPGEARDFLKSAERAITERRYLESLTEIRKAIFVEFEESYNVYGWRDYDGKKPEGLLASVIRGGWDAPHWKRRKDWIDEHVQVPTDFIQIDHEKWRLGAMELGIHTIELDNLRRLTPAVFRRGRKSGWSVTYDATFANNNAIESNSRYCLDRAVSIILKKHEHANAKREPATDVQFDPPPIYLERIVYERPATDSKQLHVISKGFDYQIHRIVGGFDPNQRFYEISATATAQPLDAQNQIDPPYFRGFLEIVDEID